MVGSVRCRAEPVVLLEEPRDNAEDGLAILDPPDDPSARILLLEWIAPPSTSTGIAWRPPGLAGAGRRKIARSLNLAHAEEPRKGETDDRGLVWSWVLVLAHVVSQTTREPVDRRWRPRSSPGRAAARGERIRNCGERDRARPKPIGAVPRATSGDAIIAPWLPSPTRRRGPSGARWRRSSAGAPCSRIPTSSSSTSPTGSRSSGRSPTSSSSRPRSSRSRRSSSSPTARACRSWRAARAPGSPADACRPRAGS